MISSSKEVDSPTKEDQGDHTSANHEHVKSTKANSSTPATSWLRLKDPRIVRVSRAFGGKDRHSKVCTIRGLRDRRVRLSVPTAIQLYDLQDRLGLNQPSKVVDWLLNAAKNEIDELPPLPILPVNFALNHQAMLSSSEIGASQSNKLNNSIINWEENQGVVGLSSRPNFWTNDAFSKNKSKQVVGNEKENWTRKNEEENNGKQESNEIGASSSFFPRTGHSSSPAASLINNAIPYTSFFQLEHPNFPLSSHMGSHGIASQTDPHNLNAIPLPSTLSLSSGSQIFPYFPSTTEIDHPRQINHFQMLGSSTQNLFPNSIITQSPYSINQSASARPFHFSLTNPRLFHPHNSGTQPDKDQD